MKDEFVIRLKKNRTVSDLSGDKKQKGKLIDYAFEHSYTFYKNHAWQYKFYRWNCGRDKRIKEVWQNKKLM